MITVIYVNARTGAVASVLVFDTREEAATYVLANLMIGFHIVVS